MGSGQWGEGRGEWVKPVRQTAVKRRFSCAGPSMAFLDEVHLGVCPFWTMALLDEAPPRVCPFWPKSISSVALLPDTDPATLELFRTIRIYNLLGQVVKTLVDGTVVAGVHRVIWDARSEIGSSVPTGVYLYRMETPEFSDTKTLILMK